MIVVLDTFVKALLMTKQMQIIDWKKFAIIALKLIEEAFVVYVSSLNVNISIHLT